MIAAVSLNALQQAESVIVYLMHLFQIPRLWNQLKNATSLYFHVHRSIASCLVLFKSEVEADDAVGVPKEPKDKLGVKAAITNRYDKTVLLQKRVVVGVGQSACGVTGFR